MVSLPTTPEGLTDLRYSDLQSLAADHGYGRIVGEQREDLVEYLASEAYPRRDGSDDRAVDGEDQGVDDSADSVETDSDRQPEQRADGGSAVEQTDSIDVGHDGKEKLSPEGAPNNDKAAVEAPENVDLGDAGMDDIEPDPEIAGRATNDRSETTSVDDGQEDIDDDDGGGPLSKLRGGSEKSSKEIVEEADDPEERDRRDDLRERVKNAMSGGSSSSADSGTDSVDGESTASAPAGTQRANGVVMDESVVGALMELPFNTASAATGWDGWELSESEREANAELFIAMCDEHDVELSAATMFALSIGGQLSGRFMRYKRETASEDEPVESSNDPAQTDGESATSDGQSEQQAQTESEPEVTDESNSDEFDFSDSSTW